MATRAFMDRHARLGGASPDHAGLSSRVSWSWVTGLRGDDASPALRPQLAKANRAVKAKLKAVASEGAVGTRPSWDASPSKTVGRAWAPLPGDETWRDELRASLGADEAARLAARLATPTRASNKATPTAKAPRYDAYARGSSVTSAGAPAAVGVPVPSPGASPAASAGFVRTYASAARSGALGSEERAPKAMARAKDFRKSERSNAGLQHVRRKRNEADMSVRRAIDAAVVQHAGEQGPPITRPSEGPPTNRGTPLRQPPTAASSLRREASDLAAGARLSPKPSASFVATPTGRDATPGTGGRPPRPGSAQGRTSPYIMRRRDAEAEAAGVALEVSPAPRRTPSSAARRRPASASPTPPTPAGRPGYPPASPAVVGSRVARELEELRTFVMVEVSALRAAAEDTGVRLARLERATSSQR